MSDRIFNNLRGIQKDMLKILGEVTTLAANPLAVHHGENEVWEPKCDVFGTNSEINIIVDLAGVDKKSIHISRSKDYIKVTGSRELNFDCDKLCYYNMEIETGSFERKIYLPELNLSHDDPSVKFENGFLYIKFTLRQPKEKVIEVEIE